MNKGLKVGLIITGSVLAAGGIAAGVTIPLVQIQQEQAKKVFYYKKFGMEHTIFIGRQPVYFSYLPNEVKEFANKLISKGYRYGGEI
jgi:hypothetical protein